jgi:hypothetical protein
MNKTVGAVVALAVVVVLAWMFFNRGGDENVAADLVADFGLAKEKRPRAETFSVADVTIGGVAKPSVLVSEPSRLVYTVTVPENGELRVSLGIQESGWAVEGDGVLFRVLVGAGGPPEEILNLVVNPFGNPSDRAWHDLSLDLSEYAGESVDLFFNTNSSPPMRPPVDNRNGDAAVWGAPRLVSR